jgi:hypothetical protein
VSLSSGDLFNSWLEFSLSFTLFCVIRTLVLSFLSSLEPLNITHVFLYRNIKLDLDMGRISDLKRSGQPRVLHTLQVINTVMSRIYLNSVQKTKNRGLGNGYCAKNHKSHYQTRLGALK